MSFQSVMNLRSRADPPATPSYSDDDEMKTMLSEIDLLSVIQADTGETGRKSGDRYDFKSCPVCGHRNCFSYYEKSNSWSCFGASNTSGYEGGTALEYYKATRTDDNTEAVKWLREETGHPYQGKQATDDEPSTDQGEQSNVCDRWRIVDTDLDNMPPLAPELIEGLLRIGRKGKIGRAHV